MVYESLYTDAFNAYVAIWLLFAVHGDQNVDGRVNDFKRHITNYFLMTD